MAEMRKLIRRVEEDPDFEERRNWRPERRFSDDERRFGVVESDDADDSDDDDIKDDTDNEYIPPQNEDTEVFSLQNLCLKSITNHFDRFNTAYAISEDAVMRRNLLFLQKLYSDHMMAEMRSRISDSCLNFLLNEYVKELHMERLYGCSDQAVLKRLSEIGHVFEKGYLIYPYSPDFDRSIRALRLVKDAVVLLPNVHTLHIPCICDDEIVELIGAYCPKLQELHIDDSLVTDEGVKGLFRENNGIVQVKCNLEIFSLKNSKVQAPGVRYLLENMPSLQTLTHHLLPSVLYSIYQDDIYNTFLEASKKFNLTSLDLFNCETLAMREDIEVPDLLNVCTVMCPHLKSLNYPVTGENNDLYLITLFSELECLSLDGSGTANMNINEFLKLQGGKLKQLKLSYLSFSAPVLLQSCPKLEFLHLRDTAFAWDDKDQVSNMPRMNCLSKLCLEHFLFQELSIEKSVAAILNGSPNLEFLDIAHCEFSDSGMNTALNTFCANSALLSLHLTCSDIAASSLESILLTCSSLRTLVIHDCENILSDNIDSFYEIVRSKRNKVNVIWRDDRSEINSLDDDFYDNYYDSDECCYADYAYYSPYEFEDGDDDDDDISDY